MVDFKKILAGAQKNWKTAKKRAAERESSFPEYDDGRYLARLIGADLGQSGSGRNQIDFSWKFLDGDYTGKVKHDYQGIDNEDNLYYLAQRIEQLGYENPDDLGELPALLKAIVKEKPVCTIVLKSKGDFQNVYIRKLHDEDEDLDETETEDEEVETEEADDEEVEEEGEESDEADDDEADEGTDDEDADEETDEEEEEVEEEEEPDEEEIDITVGMRVIAETAKGRELGKITKLIEKEGAVQVLLDNGRKVRLTVDKIEIPDDEEEVEEEPKKKPAKAAPKTVPAKKVKTVEKTKKKKTRR